MKIVSKKISDLIPADYNPRQLDEKQFEDIKNSLKEFGMVDPIVVNIHPDRTNIVVGGHQRIRVWKDLGNKEIPCVEVNLTLEKERELNIRLNKNSGSWDMDALANFFEIDELVDWGFTEDQLLDEPKDDDKEKLTSFTAKMKKSNKDEFSKFIKVIERDNDLECREDALLKMMELAKKELGYE